MGWQEPSVVQLVPIVEPVLYSGLYKVGTRYLVGHLYGVSAWNMPMGDLYLTPVVKELEFRRLDMTAGELASTLHSLGVIVEIH